MPYDAMDRRRGWLDASARRPDIEPLSYIHAGRSRGQAAGKTDCDRAIVAGVVRPCERLEHRCRRCRELARHSLPLPTRRRTARATAALAEEERCRWATAITSRPG